MKCRRDGELSGRRSESAVCIPHPAAAWQVESSYYAATVPIVGGNFMQLYKSPFSRGFWKTAAAEVKNLRALVFCALMVGMAIVLGLCSIPVAANLKISVSFLARVLAAMVGGPVMGVLYGMRMRSVLYRDSFQRSGCLMLQRLF